MLFRRRRERIYYLLKEHAGEQAVSALFSSSASFTAHLHCIDQIGNGKFWLLALPRHCYYIAD